MLGNIKDIFILIFLCCFLNFYLFELLYGDMNTAYVKGLLYFVLAFDILYTTFAKRSQFNLINKLVLFFTFLMFALTLTSLIKHKVFIIVFVNGAIIVTSFMILTSAVSHGYFKDENK